MFYNPLEIETTCSKLGDNIAAMEQALDDYIEFSLITGNVDEKQISTFTNMLNELYEQYEEISEIKATILN
jgi:hypothetical protein